MADRVFMPRALDSNGDIVPNAVAYFYEAGTLIPLVTYTDSAAGTPHGVSLEADSTGTFDPVYASQGIKVDVQDGDGVSLPGYPSDNHYITPSVGAGAASITFSPVEGNAAEDVQTAIANNTGILAAITTYGRSLVAAATAAAARATLGLGTAATSASSAFATSTQGTKADAALPAASYQIVAIASFTSITTTAFIANSGFSAITDNGTGDTTLTLSTEQDDTDYIVMLTCSGYRDATAANANRVIANLKTDASGLALKTTTQFTVTTVIGATGTLTDVDEVSVMVLRA